jgi:hypothetical protein
MSGDHCVDHYEQVAATTRSTRSEGGANDMAGKKGKKKGKGKK